MPSLKKFFEVVDYKINDGFKYGWDCYGKNAFALDAGTFRAYGFDSYWSACVVYDLETNKVYEINCMLYNSNLSLKENYRWIHPDYVNKAKREAKKRNVRFDQAYDGVDYENVGERTILIKLAEVIKKCNRKRNKKAA